MDTVNQGPSIPAPQRPSRYRRVQQPPAPTPWGGVNGATPGTPGTAYGMRSSGGGVASGPHTPAPLDGETPMPGQPQRPTRPSRGGFIPSSPDAGGPTTDGIPTPPGQPPAPPLPPAPPGNPGMTPVAPPPPVTTTNTGYPAPIDDGGPDMTNNLRGSVFTPGDDPRLAGAQGRSDSAADAVMGGRGFTDLASGAEGRYRSLFGDASDGGRYLSAQDEALASLGGPNRTELAKQALADFDASSAEGLKDRFRAVGQNAAKFGRIGMGETGKSMIDVGRLHEQDRMRYSNELARSVAEGDISDRFRRVDATSGLRGQESGIEAGLRDENFARTRSAVDLGGRDADREIADRYDRYNTATDLEGKVFGQGASNRDEYRVERGYQQGAAQDSLDNRIRERGLQNSEREQRLARAIALMDAGDGLTLEQALAMVG